MMFTNSSSARRSQGLTPSDSRILALQRAIVDWFKENARDLPWRKTSDPYKIWISEIMLQQTTVSTVIAYYHRFLKRFPNIKSLAKASEDDVLRVWQGLGYYRRARYLRDGAKFLLENFGGKFPESREELLKVPGIGAYSAGSILSIALRRPTPALDGNLIRVFSRVFLVKEPVDQTSAQKKLWGLAADVSQVSPEETRSLTEGLMELGALICRPQNPQCEECPLSSLCEAKKQGLAGSLPKKSKAPIRAKYFEEISLVESKGRIGILNKGCDSKYPHFHRLPFRAMKNPGASLKFSYKYSVTTRDFYVTVKRRSSYPQKLSWITPNQIDETLLPAIDRRILQKEFKKSLKAAEKI